MESIWTALIQALSGWPDWAWVLAVTGLATLVIFWGQFSPRRRKQDSSQMIITRDRETGNYMMFWEGKWSKIDVPQTERKDPFEDLYENPGKQEQLSRLSSTDDQYYEELRRQRLRQRKRW